MKESGDYPDPDPNDAASPAHVNCRCHIVLIISWLDDIHHALNVYIGDTNPTLERRR